MYNKEVIEKIFEKIEYDLALMKECFLIYSKLLLKKDDFDIGTKFNNFIKNYYLYSYLEYQILFLIKNQREDNNDLCLEMFFKLEEIFINHFKYNEYVLNGFYDAFLCDDLRLANFKEYSSLTLTKKDKDEFIKQLKK